MAEAGKRPCPEKGPASPKLERFAGGPVMAV